MPIRTEQYRFVLGRDSSLMLFDMLQDPGQQNNLAEEQPEQVQLLKKEFENWFAAVTERGLEAPSYPPGVFRRDDETTGTRSKTLR